ncbi:MAG: aminopeptidase [Ruminococcus sp.]|jgi:aspartyl aminopeptidase|nr:aminopeptidase [Ruminococcus sp.]
MENLVKDYKNALNEAKTEREFVKLAIEKLEENGFSEYKKGQDLKKGDKIYKINKEKTVAAAILGDSEAHIVASHIDSPRLDLKPNPLYEKENIAYLKTHYYGGIKKYQWATIPLELHGVVITKAGKIEVKIADPLFVITDLLPHLAKEQAKRTMKDVIKGEELNIVIGLNEDKDAEKDKVKANIVKILQEEYSIDEKDFVSAELSAVPAFPAVDIGFDRSLIGGYGQDDRVCSFAALSAICEVGEPPLHTAVLFLADKEEVGSNGTTGMKSKFFENFLNEIGADFETSICISADVNAGYDPTFADVFDKNNASMMGKGLVVTKYTGAGGKSGASDASAELVYYFRKIFDENNVKWQVGELGKVDIGGGGTVAAYIANLNIDTIDIGVAVLSMHSPFEVTAKDDLISAFEGYKAFLSA